MADPVSNGPKSAAIKPPNQRVAFAPVSPEFRANRATALAESKIKAGTLTGTTPEERSRIQDALKNGTAVSIKLPSRDGTNYRAVLMRNDTVYVGMSPTNGQEIPEGWMKAGTLSRIFA